MNDTNNNPWGSPIEVIQLGKYTVIHHNGILTAHLNGLPWENKTKALVGDKLALAMVQRIVELEKKLQEKD